MDTYGPPKPPEKRKVGCSTPPLTTSSDQCKRALSNHSCAICNNISLIYLKADGRLFRSSSQVTGLHAARTEQLRAEAVCVPSASMWHRLVLTQAHCRRPREPCFQPGPAIEPPGPIRSCASWRATLRSSAARLEITADPVTQCQFSADASSSSLSISRPLDSMSGENPSERRITAG